MTLRVLGKDWKGGIMELLANVTGSLVIGIAYVRSLGQCGCYGPVQPFCIEVRITFVFLFVFLSL